MARCRAARPGRTRLPAHGPVHGQPHTRRSMPRRPSGESLISAATGRSRSASLRGSLSGRNPLLVQCREWAGPSPSSGDSILAPRTRSGGSAGIGVGPRPRRNTGQRRWTAERLVATVGSRLVASRRQAMSPKEGERDDPHLKNCRRNLRAARRRRLGVWLPAQSAGRPASSACARRGAGPASPRHPRRRLQARPPAPPTPLTEDQIFERKSVADLNAEAQLADALFDYDQSTIRRGRSRGVEPGCQVADALANDEAHGRGALRRAGHGRVQPVAGRTTCDCGQVVPRVTWRLGRTPDSRELRQGATGLHRAAPSRAGSGTDGDI